MLRYPEERASCPGSTARGPAFSIRDDRVPRAELQGLERSRCAARWALFPITTVGGETAAALMSIEGKTFGPPRVGRAPELFPEGSSTEKGGFPVSI